MLEQRLLLGCEVAVDREKTRHWYDGAEEWGCQCGDCLNFVELAKRKQFPEYVLKLLAAFEIPPEKATYVCHLTEDEEGHLYQFSYRIAGEILKDLSPTVIPEARCCHEPYPYGAPDFPQPHFDLEFYVSLPWILRELGE